MKYLFYLIGLLSGICLTWYISKSSELSKTKHAPEPLYWVAPMDDNYRRNQPGLSPMGMELIPVYKENQNDDESTSGTVVINPHVEQQMGVKHTTAFWGQLNIQHIAQGIVRYNQETLHHVHAKTSGWIQSMSVFSVGDWVDQGQHLYSIYTPDWINAQQELIFAINQNDHQLTQAAEQRLIALQFPKDTIEKVKKKRHVIQSIPFYASQSGFVTTLNVKEGHVVKPEDTLMVIADTSQMWLDVEWFEPIAGQIKTQQLIEATSATYANRHWQGKIDHIYPSADEVHRTLVTRTILDNNDQQLKANMLLQVSLTGSKPEPQLLIPSSAVIQFNHQNRVVLALGQGKYKSVAVEVGQQDDQFSAITSGLKAEDKVVISAQFLLDSESSKRSDFQRMGDETWPTATVIGTVNHINHQQRLLNISREAITKWQKPPATMDFEIINGIELNQLRPGSQISFQFEIRHSRFIIIHFEVINYD